MSTKASPPKEILLENQTITQATAVCMREEKLAAKRRAYQMANGNLTW